MKQLASAFMVAALAGAGLVAQEIHSPTLLTTDHYLDWERVTDAQIAPDGSRIVYTRQTVNKQDEGGNLGCQHTPNPILPPLAHQRVARP